MAKAKSKSKKKKNVAVKAKPEDVKQVPVDVEAEDELSAGEKFFMASKPYWAHILLAVLIVVFATVLWRAWDNIANETASQPWRELNNAMTQADLTNDVSSLKEMADEYGDNAAGHWALLMAADNEVDRGIRMLARDRVGGLKLIEKGSESLQKVVDAPAASKSPMVQRRSTFMLASAKEALGKFAEAKTLYQSLLDAAPESPFTDLCKRGVARCSNDDLIAIYQQFRDWEETPDVAPGPLVPDAPKLNFDEVKLPEGEPDTFSGGDFGDDKMKKESDEEKAESSTSSPESTEEPAAKDDAAEEKKDEAAAENDNSEAEAESTDESAEKSEGDEPNSEDADEGDDGK